MCFSTIKGTSLFMLLIYVFPRHIRAIKYTFTRMDCAVLDKELLKFEDCGVNENNEAHMRLKVLRPPLDNISVQVVLMRYASGEYKSFFLNTEYDVCKFLKSHRNPLVQYLFQFLKPYTSLNHGCPFSEPYMYLKKFRVNETMLRPMKIILDGNYSFFSTWMTHKVKRMKIDLYFTWES